MRLTLFGNKKSKKIAGGKEASDVQNYWFAAHLLYETTLWRALSDALILD